MTHSNQEATSDNYTWESQKILGLEFESDADSSTHLDKSYSKEHRSSCYGSLAPSYWTPLPFKTQPGILTCSNKQYLQLRYREMQLTAAIKKLSDPPSDWSTPTGKDSPLNDKIHFITKFNRMPPSRIPQLWLHDPTELYRIEEYNNTNRSCKIMERLPFLQEEYNKWMDEKSKHLKEKRKECLPEAKAAPKKHA